jgi:hypothetical protein
LFCAHSRHIKLHVFKSIAGSQAWELTTLFTPQRRRGRRSDVQTLFQLLSRMEGTWGEFRPEPSLETRSVSCLEDVYRLCSGNPATATSSSLGGCYVYGIMGGEVWKVNINSRTRDFGIR